MMTILIQPARGFVTRCRRHVLPAAAALALAAPASAGARGPAVATLHQTAGYTGQLGVDAQGGAVVAWSESLTPRYIYSVLVRVRRPGGTFGAVQRLSTGEVERPFALAVGASGVAAVLWWQILPSPENLRNNRPQPRVLLVSRARPGGRFGAPQTVTSDGLAAESTVAIDGRGRLLVAWTHASGRPGCGRVVMARVGSSNGRFGAARRISTACPNAMLLRAALARNGAGAVSWRAGRSLGSSSAFAVHVSTYDRGRFAAPRTVSRGRAWYGQPSLAAGGSRLLVAWRDRARLTRAGIIRGRVLTAAIDGATVGAPTAVSTSDEIEGDVYAAMNSSDAAIVSWTQRSRGDAGNRIAVRQAAGGHFAATEAISPCAPGVSAGGSGRDNLDTAAHATLDADDRAVAIFASGCGGVVGAARRPAGGLWQPAFGLTPPATTSSAVRILAAGVSDAGEAVAAWWNQPPDAPGFDDAALDVAVLPAP
jgi:hypothetical protein